MLICTKLALKLNSVKDKNTSINNKKRKKES